MDALKEKRNNFVFFYFFLKQFDKTNKNSTNNIGIHRERLVNDLESYKKTLENIPNVYIFCLNIYIKQMNEYFAGVKLYFSTNRLIILHHTAKYHAMAKVLNITFTMFIHSFFYWSYLTSFKKC